MKELFRITINGEVYVVYEDSTGAWVLEQLRRGNGFNSK